MDSHPVNSARIVLTETRGDLLLRNLEGKLSLKCMGVNLSSTRRNFAHNIQAQGNTNVCRGSPLKGWCTCILINRPYVLYQIVPIFSCFSLFSLKNDVSGIILFPMFDHFLSWVPFCFLFPAYFFSWILSRFSFHCPFLVSYFIVFKKSVSPTPTAG